MSAAYSAILRAAILSAVAETPAPSGLLSRYAEAARQADDVELLAFLAERRAECSAERAARTACVVRMRCRLASQKPLTEPNPWQENAVRVMEDAA